jgi:glycosyltransferase involved in cell wall biosynthesis
MQQALLALIAQEKPDAVLIQFPHMAQYVAFCGGTATVMDVQDAFSVSAYRSYRSARGGLRKCVALLSWLAWIQYETRWYPRYSVVSALTPQDRAGLAIFIPGLAASVSPAAVSLPDTAWAPVDSQTIAFMGSFAHQPNVEAVLFSVNQVLPLVLQELPQAVFQVAGKGAPPAMLALAGKHVQMVGMVENSGAFLRSAAVVVIPLQSGGGIKIKTLEAMACGCPVVSSSIGAEETGAISGTHLLVADTAADFARQTVALLKDADAALRLGSNARALAAAQFSWQAKRVSLNAQLALAVDRQEAMRHRISAQP